MLMLKHIITAAFLALACTAGETTSFKIEKAGLPEGLNASFVHWLDYDKDGRPDLLVGGARLFHNISTPGNPLFEEKTAEAGLANGGVALCFDYDNDGWTDIVTSHPHVWHNQGNGRFEDRAAALSFPKIHKAMAMAAGDLDGDARPDLFIGMGENWNDGNNPEYFPAQLWLNKPEKWTEAGKKAGINRSTYARGILIRDVNNDGYQDVFVANYRLQANLLWLNDGKGNFTENAHEYNLAGKHEPRKFYDKIIKRHYGFRYGHCIGACWSDFDNDGIPDLFVANLVHKYVGPSGRNLRNYDIRGYICDDSAFYKKVRSGFQDWRPRLNIPYAPIGGQGVFKGDELWAGCAPADVDNDGWEDIFVPQVYNLPYAKCLLLINHHGQSFNNQASFAGIERIDTYCGAWADVDGDGFQDLVTAGRPEKDAKPALIFYKNQGNKNPWLKVTLAPGKNGTAIGAVVTLNIGGKTQSRVNSAGISSYGQQNDPTLHFGLGPHPPRSLTLNILWPQGNTSTVQAKPGDIIALTND